MTEKIEQKNKKIDERLLNKQTKVILSAVDIRFITFKKDIEKLLVEQTNTILTAVNHKISKLEEKLIESETRLNAKLDRLTTTLDGFLKRLTDLDDEFTAMRHDIDRIKKTIKEKLGVNLT